jgi:two-component system, sensor histidine kinase and response regulator
MDPSPETHVPRIPGIDSADLMERIGEDLQLFWEVLSDFGTTCRDSPAQIAQALAVDPVEGKHLAHTLKGVLGNIGATELFAVCKSLDDAIREGRAELYPDLLDTLSREVPALCDAIAHAHAAAPTEPAAAPGPAPGSDWLAERCRALRAALEGHRARDCKALVEEIAATDLPAAERELFDNLQALVRTYRFKDAQAMLERHLAI